MEDILAVVAFVVFITFRTLRDRRKGQQNKIPKQVLEHRKVIDPPGLQAKKNIGTASLKDERSIPAFIEEGTSAYDDFNYSKASEIENENMGKIGQTALEQEYRLGSLMSEPVDLRKAFVWGEILLGPKFKQQKKRHVDKYYFRYRA